MVCHVHKHGWAENIVVLLALPCSTSFLTRTTTNKTCMIHIRMDAHAVTGQSSGVSSDMLAGYDLLLHTRAGATGTVLAVALFEIRPFLAFANFVACYGLGLQRINTSLLWASPVPGTSTNQHLAVSVAVATYH